MINVQFLDATVQELEREPNINRIKKLILCVCQGTWENNTSRLDSLNLRDLLTELCETTASVENLQYSLNGIVSKINKPQQYAALAKIIITKVNKLYPNFQEEPTQPDLHGGYYDAKTLVLANLESSKETDFQSQEPSEEKKVISREALFDLRLKVVQHTSPLRAKIVLFSALDRPFEFNREEDWLMLKKMALDDLLQQLYGMYESLEPLEHQLYETAQNLPESDENLQAAGTIVQYISPFYGNPQSDRGLQQQLEEAIAAQNIYYNSEQFEAGHEDDRTIDFVTTDFFGEGEDTNEDNSELLSEGTESTSSNADRKFSLSALKATDPVKQRQQLEDRLNELVNVRVKEVVTFIEDRLSDLETEIGSEVQEQELEDLLSLKYEALGEFVSKIKYTSSQFMELLSRLEESERKRLIEENKL